VCIPPCPASRSLRLVVDCGGVGFSVRRSALYPCYRVVVRIHL